MPSEPSLFIDVRLGGRTFRRLNLDHPEVEARIIEEIEAGVPVYYDRAWRLTDRFVRWLLVEPETVAGRDVLVVGAGVGLESAAIGHLCRRLRVNDMAPVALELLERQLRANGVRPAETLGGSFADVPLAAGVELVVGCFVVYDRGTRRAMERLLDRTAERDLPVLLADEDIGGHFGRLLERVPRPFRVLHEDGEGRVVLFEPKAAAG